MACAIAYMPPFMNHTPVQQLDHRDDHVQRGAFERRDADIERLERERLAQPVVLHMMRDRRVRVAERVQAQTGYQAFRVVEIDRFAKRAFAGSCPRDEERLYSSARYSK